MNEFTITISYILIIILGLGWVFYKVAVYIRNEKDRESRLNDMLVYDDQFKDYLRMLKQKGTAVEANGMNESGELAGEVSSSEGAEQLKN